MPSQNKTMKTHAKSKQKINESPCQIKKKQWESMPNQIKTSQWKSMPNSKKNNECPFHIAILAQHCHFCCCLFFLRWLAIPVSGSVLTPRFLRSKLGEGIALSFCCCCRNQIPCGRFLDSVQLWWVSTVSALSSGWFVQFSVYWDENISEKMVSSHTWYVVVTTFSYLLINDR